MLNRIIIMGRLVRDPDLRTTQNGTPVTSFTLAVDRDYKSRDSGEKSTDFIDVVAWRQTAEFICKYFSKGRMAVAEGRLQIRDWKDREGNNRRSAEVVADNVYFGDSKRDSNPDRDSYGPPPYGSPVSSSYNSGSYGGGSYGSRAPEPESDAEPQFPPASSGGYDLPSGGEEDSFKEIQDEDSELPF